MSKWKKYISNQCVHCQQEDNIKHFVFLLQLTFLYECLAVDFITTPLIHLNLVLHV